MNTVVAVVVSTESFKGFFFFFFFFLKKRGEQDPIMARLPDRAFETSTCISITLQIEQQTLLRQMTSTAYFVSAGKSLKDFQQI